MTDKNATEEDLNMVYFQDVYDSPAKSDTSSVDIYDGLDISSIPAEPPVLSTPTKDCLDLYEEILTEEVTAKEASFNDLHAEYEKCQKQMKELVNRLKEMQTQNTTLQNENQCLKKNISAVIKTARVEINRKEDEINRLNQRLFSSVNPRVNKHIPVPLSEPNKTSCHLESRSNRTQPKNMDSCGKSELQKHTVHPKRNDSTQSNYQPTEKDLNAGGKNSSGSSKPSCAKLFKISETDLEIQPKNMDSCGKSELQKHTVHPKRNDSTHLSYQTTEKELNAGGKNSSGSSKPSCAKLFKISETDLEKKCTEGYLNQDAAKGRKERNVECQSKDSERKQRKEECKSSSSSSASEKKIVELKENGPTSNSVTMDSGLENQATKFDLLNERNRKSLSSASHDKACSMRDRAQSKEDPRTKEKLRKPYESYSRRDSKDYDKGKGSEHRSRPTEKEDPPRRSQRASHLKDEGSYKVKTELNDHRRSSDTSRREKHSSDYNKDSKSGYRDSKLISGSKNEHKMSSKKEDQHLLNRKSVKSSRDKKDESKGSKEKEGSHRDRKEYKEFTDEGKLKELSSDKQSSEVKSLCKTDNQCKPLNTEKQVVDPNEKETSTVRDLKLSYMETLNLTLSPAKKSLSDSNTNKLPLELCDVKCGISEMNNPEPMPQVCESLQSINEVKSESSRKSNAGPIIVTNDPPIKQVTKSNINMENKTCQAKQVVDEMICTRQNQPIEETNSAPSNAVLSVANPEKADENNELHILHSDDMETSVVDVSQVIDLDSYIELDKCSGSESPFSDNVDEDSVAQTGFCQENLSPSKQLNKESEHNTNFLKNVTEPAKEFYYANGSTSAHLSKELNKENFQPALKNDPSSGKCSPIIISSDDMEEGEILSDVDEVTCVQARHTIPSPKQSSVVQMNINEDSANFQREDTSLRKPNGMISPRKQSATKSKGKCKSDLKIHLLKQPNKKERKINPDNCLEEIMKTDQPSSVQDVLQMLRAIRKHIRKKYMKFKMQFTVRQYHKVIEVGTSYFITLVKKVNWTALCSLPSSLQKKLCKYIDNKMKKLKKNGIVDRIFEQHLLDMKKKLWNFVDDQLDSLFETLKIMLTKLCDKAELESINDKNRIQNNISSSVRIRGSKIKKSRQEKHKSAPISDPNLKKDPLESQCKAQVSNIKDQNNKTGRNSVSKKDSPSREPVKRPVDVESVPKSKILIEKNIKPALAGSCESQKLKPDNSGLSFNLVSDDHMGDIFKNLLNDLEALEQTKTSGEQPWVLKTPEKTNISSQKMSLNNENTPLKTSLQLPSSVSWPPHSPVQSSSFSTLEMVVNPDALDESCMLEIPFTSSSGKSLDEKPKSYSSILMEDLAVSLTVPSPLKSDSHLSFLRLGAAPEYVSEEVISAHYSDSALLEEEDVAEQDIHLTLDSDNSNSSLENTSDTSSFQCLPSEPMQAVIMEKSNDHFIVKIRRAASTSSPNSEYPVTENFSHLPPQSTNADVKDLADHLKNVNFEEHEPHGENSPHKIENNKAVDLKLLPQKDEHEITVSLFKPPKPLSPSKDSNFVSTSYSNMDQLFHSVKGKKDCEKSNLSSEQVSKDSISCKEESFESIAQVNWNDKDQDRKRKKGLKEEPLAKRRQVQCLNPETKEKNAKEHGKEKSDTLSKEKSQKKHKRSVSDGTLQLSSSPKDSSNCISAKNVIKKKGEVVVTWSRDEDRLILLNCQQLGADQKTFISLSSKMNKHPHEIEERFRQLMKLFKKCRYSAT